MKNWTRIYGDTENSIHLEFVIAGDAKNLSEVHTELLEIAETILELGAELIRPRELLYRSVDADGNARPESLFRQEREERPNRSNTMVTDLSADDPFQPRELDEERFLTKVFFKQLSARIRLRDGEFWIDRSNKERYKCSKNGHPVEWAPYDDPLSIDIRLGSSYDPFDEHPVVYRVAVHSVTDVWLAENPVGQVNRIRLQEFLSGITEEFQTINTKSKQRGYDSERAAELLKPPGMSEVTSLGRLETAVERVGPEIRRALNVDDRDSLRRYLDAGQPALRREAVEAIGECGSESDIQLLTPRLEDTNADVVAVTLRAIQQLIPASSANGFERRDQLLEQSQKLIAHQNPSVRASAAHLIGELVKPSDWDVLLDYLKERFEEDPDSRVREALLDVLAPVPSKETIAFLVDALDDPDEAVQASAVRSLGVRCLAPPGGSSYAEFAREQRRNRRPRISTFVESENDNLRLATAKGIATAPDSAFTDELCALLDDQNPEVRKHAVTDPDPLDDRYGERLDTLAMSDPDRSVRDCARDRLEF